MSNKTHSLIFILLLAALVLTSCGGNVASSNQPTLPSANSGEAGGEGGVETALVTYSDSVQGFSIGYPGSWSQDKSVTEGVKFVGGDDWLTLSFVTPPARTDVMTSQVIENTDGFEKPMRFPVRDPSILAASRCRRS